MNRYDQMGMKVIVCHLSYVSKSLFSILNSDKGTTRHNDVI